MDVPASAQPSASHAAAIEHVSEAALDQFAAPARRLAPDRPIAFVVSRPSSTRTRNQRFPTSSTGCYRIAAGRLRPSRTESVERRRRLGLRRADASLKRGPARSAARAGHSLRSSANQGPPASRPAFRMPPGPDRAASPNSARRSPRPPRPGGRSESDGGRRGRRGSPSLSRRVSASPRVSFGQAKRQNSRR